jgi:hypothetical protein
MDHHELHFGIVNGALRRCAPGFLGLREIGEDADDFDRRFVEIERLRILDAAAEHEMELAHGGPISRTGTK